MKVCAEPGCPTLTSSTYCPTHTPAPWAGSTRRSELPRNWEKIRRRVLKRDGYRCVRCGAPASEVDHIGNPLDHDPANLQSLCTDCHKAKTQGEAARGRRRW